MTLYKITVVIKFDHTEKVRRTKESQALWKAQKTQKTWEVEEKAKWDDFWWIERLWAIMGTEVYREPRVWTVKKLMRRVREASKNIDQRTLIKLVHQSPAKMNEIYRLKGKRIPPSFDPKKSKFASKCSVCLS